MKKLTLEFRVISLDLRGHGLSEKPHESELYGALMADDVIDRDDLAEIDVPVCSATRRDRIDSRPATAGRRTRSPL